MFSLMREFNDDSFFGGPMDNMRRMESMMDNMMAPFGGMFGRQRAHAQQSQNNMANSLMPFGFGGSLFPNMDDMFGSFNPIGQISQISNNPSSHSFMSHSVTTYTTDETGRPQVYQASSSTRTAPGGVKETRRTVQDSVTGLQEMAIGHHLNDKGHVVEKKKYRYTGEEEENHEYINLDDDETETFDQEWQNRAQAFNSRPMHSMIDYDSRRRARTPPQDLLAITDGSSSVLSANETEEEASLVKEKVAKKMRTEISKNVEQSPVIPKKKSGKHKRKHGHGSSSHKNAGSHTRLSPYQ